MYICIIICWVVNIIEVFKFCENNDNVKGVDGLLYNKVSFI